MDRTKTRNTFTVPLLPPAVALLNLYLNPEVDAEKPIFPVISNQKMNAALKVIQEVAGIDKPLHSHLPRHTFATTIGLENGVPMETISKMLGHTKLATTQIYGKVGEVRIADDMSRLLQHLTSTDKL
jgi:site-specific recombinase XerD